MLTLHKIHKSFRNGSTKVKVAENIDLSIHEGQSIGLTGPSGSGKSTIGRIALGLQIPDKGRVTFAGRDISHLRKKQKREFRKNIQLVTQHPESAFNPRRSLDASLREVFRFHPICHKPDEDTVLCKMLARVHIHPQLLKRYPSQLSGGELQRLAIARAILTKPRILVLDEITSMLDVSVQAAIIQTLKGLQQHEQTGYLFITHNHSLAAAFCRRIYHLERGRLTLSFPISTTLSR